MAILEAREESVILDPCMAACHKSSKVCTARALLLGQTNTISMERLLSCKLQHSACYRPLWQDPPRYTNISYGSCGMWGAIVLPVCKQKMVRAGSILAISLALTPSAAAS